MTAGTRSMHERPPHTALGTEQVLVQKGSRITSGCSDDSGEGKSSRRCYSRPLTQQRIKLMATNTTPVVLWMSNEKSASGFWFRFVKGPSNAAYGKLCRVEAVCAAFEPHAEML